MAGLTDSGFQARTIAEVLEAIEAFQLANIDPELNQEADGVLGNLNGIVAAQIQQLEELAQLIYQATFPDTATGIPLSNLANLTGIARRPATKATVPIKIVGTVSTVIPAGAEVSVQGDAASQFEFTEAWTILTPSADVVTVTATEPGSTTDAKTTDTGVIDTPVAGFDSFTFDVNAEKGEDEETDTELRARREAALAQPGTGTIPAIEADILAVADVESVTVFENTTDVPTDVTGLPIFNIEAVVGGGVGSNEQDIIDQLWLSKPAGIATFGDISGTATDSSGTSHTLYFSRPIQVPIQIELDVVLADFSVTVQEIKDALVEWADTWVLGEDVTLAGIIEIVMGLAGVENVPPADVFIGRLSPPALNNADLTILDREIATLADGNITVNVI